MKRILLLACLLAAPGLSQADWHTFTSADGSKKIEAEVVGYDAGSGNVTLKMRDNRRITAPASAFSESDQSHIESVGLALSLGRSLWVEFDDVENVVSEKRNPANGYQTLKLENGFQVEVRNNGKVPFEGLTAEYQIFYAAYKDPFKDNARTDQLQRGKVEIPSLQPREETVVKTDTVGMTTIKRLPLSQCTGGT